MAAEAEAMVVNDYCRSKAFANLRVVINEKLDEMEARIDAIATVAALSTTGAKTASDVMSAHTALINVFAELDWSYPGKPPAEWYTVLDTAIGNLVGAL